MGRWLLTDGKTSRCVLDEEVQDADLGALEPLSDVPLHLVGDEMAALSGRRERKGGLPRHDCCGWVVIVTGRGALRVLCARRPRLLYSRPRPVDESESEESEERPGRISVMARFAGFGVEALVW